VNRLIVGSILVLVLGIPLVGVIYFMDRHVDPGPNLVQRQIIAGEEAVRKNPNQVGARTQLALAYSTVGRYSDAIVQFTEILKVEPDNRAALLGRGWAYIQAGDFDAAAKDCQAIVDAAKGGEMANVDPQLEAAYYSLGVIALKQSRPTDAVTSLTKAIGIDRTDADALGALGTAFLATGDAKSAVVVLRRAIALVPTGWTDPYAELSKAYTALNDAAGTQYADAMVAFTQKHPDVATAGLKSLTSGPYAIDALIGLGLIAEEEADLGSATAYYSQVLAKEPQNFAAITGLNRLGATPLASPTPSIAAPSPSAAGST
jgi:tetratricopeptide (TPR) repeat protein